MAIRYSGLGVGAPANEYAVPVREEDPQIQPAQVVRLEGEGDARWETNGQGLYASARPFTFKADIGGLNLVYKIKVWDDPTNQWVSVTKKLRQTVSLGSTSVVIVDPSQILSDTVMTKQRILGGGSIRMEHTLRKFEICGTAEYLGADGLLTHEQNETIWEKSGERFVVDAAPQHKQVAMLAENDYMRKFWVWPTSHSVTAFYRFATNRPDRIHRCDPEPYSTDANKGFNDYVSYFQNTGRQIKVQATIYVEDGSSWTGDIANESGLYGHFSVGVGTRQLKEYLGASTWNSITSSGTLRVTKIEYWLFGDGKRLTNKMTTLVSNKNCCIEGEHSVELIWKNRIGGNDTFVLKGSVSIEDSHEFETFQRVQGFRRDASEDSEANQFDPLNYMNTFHQGSTNVAKINIKAMRKMKVISQFMNRETIEWVSEIATAPRVWIRESYADVADDSSANFTGYTGQGGYLQQVYLNTSDVTLKDKKTGLGQIEFDIIYSNPITTQRM